MNIFGGPFKVVGLLGPRGFYCGTVDQRGIDYMIDPNYVYAVLSEVPVAYKAANEPVYT